MTSAQVVAVTGCDSGFGHLAAITLASQGWAVVAGCLTKEGCEALKKEKVSVAITPVQVNVTDDKSVAAFAEAVAKVCKGKGLNGLINNAGFAPTGYIEWAPLSDLQSAMDVNVYGQIRVTKACLPMIRQAQGRIVNVSSICGRLAFGGCAWYNATKYAVEGWTDSLRREMAPFGVSVHIVEPGFFQTQMVNIDQYSKQLKIQFDNMPAEAQKAYGQQTLTGYVQNIKDQVAMMADPDTSKVVTAMVTCLTSRTAKTRYPVGGSARFLFMPISHMPTWFVDAILAGLNQKYKPDGTVSQGIRRWDLVSLWLLGVPLLSYGLWRHAPLLSYGKCSNFSSLGSASASAGLVAWCLSWKWS